MTESAVRKVPGPAIERIGSLERSVEVNGSVASLLPRLGSAKVKKGLYYTIRQEPKVRFLIGATMLTRKSIINYFVDADIADLRVDEVNTTNDFCGFDQIDEFGKAHRVQQVFWRGTIVHFHKLSGDERSCRSPPSLAALGSCFENVDENTKKVILVSLNKQFNSQAEFYRLFVKESSIPGFPLPNVYYVQTADDGENSVPMIILQNLKMANCGVRADGEQEQNCGLTEFNQLQANIFMSP
uniref:Uncharacterized protein n=1 Tax=Ditylenchus dipsaci TaxID=166011 RepID=A0A915E5M7_9BILA